MQTQSHRRRYASVYEATAAAAARAVVEKVARFLASCSLAEEETDSCLFRFLLQEQKNKVESIGLLKLCFQRKCKRKFIFISLRAHWYTSIA